MDKPSDSIEEQVRILCNEIDFFSNFHEELMDSGFTTLEMLILFNHSIITKKIPQIRKLLNEHDECISLLKQNVFDFQNQNYRMNHLDHKITPFDKNTHDRIVKELRLSTKTLNTEADAFEQENIALQTEIEKLKKLIENKQKTATERNKQEAEKKQNLEENEYVPKHKIFKEVAPIYYDPNDTDKTMDTDIENDSDDLL